jgi:hypothetical protein
MREQVVSYNKYYCINGEPYTKTFPIEWATNHLPSTGPESCKNCAKYGTWNGVFVCYCSNCANMYNGKRGPGVNDYLYKGENLPIEEDNSKLAAMNSYLRDIKLSDIGDKDIWDSAKYLEIKTIDQSLWWYFMLHKMRVLK